MLRQTNEYQDRSSFGLYCESTVTSAHKLSTQTELVSAKGQLYKLRNVLPFSFIRRVMFFKRLIIVIIESIILLALDPKKNILIY